MNAFVLKNKINLITIIYIIISLILMIVSSPTLNFSPRVFLGMIVYPFITAYNSITIFFANFFLSIKENEQLKKENEQLKKEIKKLKEIQYNYDYIIKENMILKNLLKLPIEQQYPSEVAKIISKDPSNLYSTVIINKGYTSKIKVGMPVYCLIDGEKIAFGKIIECGPYYSKVLTIFDPRSYISVKDSFSNNTALCKGEAPKSFELTILYFLNSVDIKFNSLFITSGLSTDFPEGYKVGKVSFIRKTNYGLYQEVRLKPFINISEIDYVFVLLKENSIWDKVK
jgi:rod shape-determining protein MreC